jgi:hypothetical protein
MSYSNIDPRILGFIGEKSDSFLLLTHSLDSVCLVYLYLHEKKVSILVLVKSVISILALALRVVDLSTIGK